MTEDHRRWRGDWLIEALVAMRARGDTYWETIPLKPLHMTGRGAGRFHQPTGKFWPDAGESPAASPPRYKLVSLPPESDIDYPGETWWLTPSWQREMEARMTADGLMHEFRAYERNLERIGAAIAYYSPHRKAVVWGPHSHEVRACVLLASDLTPCEAKEAAHA